MKHFFEITVSSACAVVLLTLTTIKIIDYGRDLTCSKCEKENYYKEERDIALEKVNQLKEDNAQLTEESYKQFEEGMKSCLRNKRKI